MAWFVFPSLGIAIIVLLWLGPKFQTAWLTQDPTVRFDKENEARKTLATMIGGLAIVISLYSTTMTLYMTQEGQITDRYSKAVEHLGALDGAGHPQVEVRLGGIYALARIARDSKKDKRTVDDVLSAYLRQNSLMQTKDECDDAGMSRADLQAALWSLGNLGFRGSEDGVPSLNLREINFCRYSFVDAHLENAFFTRANLRRADLQRAGLTRAKLEQVNFDLADLREADLSAANLRASTFSESDLRGAKLIGAVLTEARFKAAKLENADLTDAKLELAEFEGVNLERTRGLCLEQVKGMKTDGRTRLPSSLPNCSRKN